MIYDKENAASPGPSKVSGRTKTFSRLLTDATNHVRYEYDKTVAISFTVDEALSVMAEWGRENSDLELAKKVSSQLEDELKQKEKVLLKNDEAAALRLAIEETRRIKALAREKELKEQRDAEYAKAMHESDQKEVQRLSKLIEEDEKEAHRLAKMMEDDEKLAHRRARELEESDEKEAHRLAREFDGADAGVAEDTKCSDEKDIGANYYNDCKGGCYMDRKDDEYSESKEDYCDGSNEGYHIGTFVEDEDDEEDVIQQAMAKIFQLESDSNIALQTQDSLNSLASKEQQRRVSKDYRLSRRLAVKTEREAHRLAKFQQMQKSFERSHRDARSIRRLWLTAEADVESVCECVCITILLPNIVDLVVRASKSGSMVRMLAKRLVVDDVAESTPDNSTFRAEFRLQCEGGVKIADTQLSHDYSSETGLLHIYIEGVLLDCDEDVGGSGDAKGTDSECKASSQSERTQKKTKSKTMDMLKQSFLRTFNAAK